nr:hypothetical protein [Pseudoxanthomonas sp.]
MPKTLVNLDPEDRAWLDQEARRLQVPMTELVRRAVRGYRQGQIPGTSSELDELLARTSGLWPQGDGLAWQQSLRNEWHPET